MVKIGYAIGLMGSVIPLMSLAASGDAAWRDTRSTIREWVKTEALISEEKNAWQGKQAMLRQSVDLLEKESDELASQIAGAKSRVAEKREAQKRLESTLKDQQKIRELVRSRVIEWERKVRELMPVLPPPLKDRLESSLARLPEKPQETGLKLVERLRNIIGILKEINAFHAKVTLADEVRTNRQKEKVHVQVLYIGLGQAYFVDKTGRFAGWGVPDTEGWQWERQPEIGPAVRRAIAIYEKQKAPAFVGLPAQIE